MADVMRLIYGSPVQGKHSQGDYYTERTRLAKWQADKIEMELRERSDELVEVEQVQRDWFKLLYAARASLLAMPTKLAPQLAAARAPHEAQKLVKDEVYAALTELSQYEPDEE